MRVLLVEDDKGLGAAVRDQIAADDHSVDWVCLLDDAREHFSLAPYDLILLDLMLPDGRGLTFLRELRAAGTATPVIIMTAMDQVADRIAGLDAGADDYLVKPFDLQEMTARIKSVSRRYSGNPNPRITHGSISVDLAARQLWRDGEAITLTAREWSLLEAFLKRPGAIFSKAQLEERCYSFADSFESNTVEVHVSRLRKKLGADMIETIRGVGYRLRANG